MKSDHSLTPYTETNSKWIKDLNVRQKDSIKLLEKNTLWHKLQQYLFQSVSQNNGNKSKNKLDPLKIKSICTAMETINKTERQPTDWEKIFANLLWRQGISLQNLQRAHDA